VSARVTIRSDVSAAQSTFRLVRAPLMRPDETSSNPVSPTSSKTASDLRKLGSGAVPISGLRRICIGYSSRELAVGDDPEPLRGREDALIWPSPPA
jgi:hypothetical protein